MVEEDIFKVKELLIADVEVLLEQKAKLYGRISKLEADLIEAKNSEKSQLADLWNATIWEDVFTGKFTLDNKKAYIGEHIRGFKADCERIENEIKDCKNRVDIINDVFKLGGFDD